MATEKVVLPLSISGKLLKKIINQVFELNSILYPSENGYRKNRSTTHSLLDVQSQIPSVLLSESDLIAIFFDMEKVYKIWYGDNS